MGISRSDLAPWHTRSVEETTGALGVGIERGLGAADVSARLERYGPNALAEKKPRSILATIATQFRSLMVGLLVAAGGVALALGNTMEGLAIGVVIIVNAAIGFATEWKAARALEGLRRQEVQSARVVRDGVEGTVPARGLVPGDVTLLFAGDRVPADGRLVASAHLRVDESALTGESIPAEKSTIAVDGADAGIGDRSCMVHMGTAVTEGRARFIVTATGSTTEVGHIGALIDAAETRDSPLEAKLSQLSRALLVIVLVLCAVIVVVGWLRGHALLFMIEVGISLAIAAVPEGLLAVTTMTLAVGMQRMARMHALVRRLPAVEALGSTTVICSDKTGTLTRNEMTVRVLDVGGRRVDVSGTGYASEGALTSNGQPITQADLRTDGPLALALRIGALCNDARLERSGERTTVSGDPTEAALIVAAEKVRLDRAGLERDYPRTGEIPFTSESKRMETTHRTPSGRSVVYVKGAPAAVIGACTAMLDGNGVVVPLSSAARLQAMTTNEDLAGAALRVLALAYRELPAETTRANDDGEPTRALVLVGMVGMIDPLRDEAKATIATCRSAGIRAVMITGDQAATAAEIAHQLGLDIGIDGKPLKTVRAQDLVNLDADDWSRVVRDAAVFARVSPEDKLRIVEALQGQGHVVAMTGDGVNDAPALRQADIGVAMGIRGTEVAKEAADMILTDDDFSTIVSAVEQGRIVVHNIVRFIHYLFSCNFSEIVTVFGAIVIGWPLPLAVLQILWLNLITDIFPAMALALEPSAPDIMTRPPRDPAEPLMTPRFGGLILWQGTLLGGCTLATFALGLRWYGAEGLGARHAGTMAFMALALLQVLHAFNARSQTRSVFSSSLFTNRWLWGATLLCLVLQVASVTLPPLRTVLGTTPLHLRDWGVVGAASLVPVAVIELVKVLARWRSVRAATRATLASKVQGAHGASRADTSRPAEEAG